MNVSRTMHLFCFGCGIGAIIFGILVKLNFIDWIEPSKFLLPLGLGVVILIWEWLVNKK